MRVTVWLAGLLACATCVGRENLMEIDWGEAAPETPGGHVELLPPEEREDFARLKITNPADERLTAEALIIDNPGITSSRYSITGKVRHEGVEGEGYLEMWSRLPGEGRFFSRTLGSFGPTKHLKGSSGWRFFALPFYITDSETRPDRLTLNVILPGRGTVVLGPLTLAQFGPHEDPTRGPGQWWGGRTGGLIGGIAGGIIGLLGGIVGMLAGRGVARRFVLGVLRVLIAGGVASLVVGLVALLTGQSYAVYYPLLLLGIICTVVPWGMLGRLRRRYEELEMRRMQSMDAG